MFRLRAEGVASLTCDKDLSGIVTDGHVFRFVACQFGQKTAGSPLGSIVRAVARFFARLTDPVHVAAWVDDLIFIMSTPEHGGCAGSRAAVRSARSTAVGRSRSRKCRRRRLGGDRKSVV